MSDVFDDEGPFDEWPESKRLLFIRHQARRIPGAMGTLPIELLVKEFERLSTRLSLLEDRRVVSDGEPLSSCARCGKYVLVFHGELYDHALSFMLLPEEDGLWGAAKGHVQHVCSSAEVP